MQAQSSEKVCKKCGEMKPLEAFSRHRETKDGRRNHCKTCAAKDLKQWRKISPKHREYVERNREKERERLHRRYLANRERVKALAKAWNDAHREHVLERNKRYYEANRKRMAEWQREYYEQNREAYFRRAAERRALKRTTQTEPVSHSVVFERDQGLCGLCGEPVSPSDWHLDHIVPLSLGGPHTYDNVQVAHPRCNLTKGVKLPEEVVF